MGKSLAGGVRHLTPRLSTLAGASFRTTLNLISRYPAPMAIFLMFGEIHHAL